MLWSALLFIITISLLVTVHEFGHFIIARLCGVRVECFSIGFGKKIWSHKFASGTEFVIAMIPLGGYIRMLDARVTQLADADKKFAYNYKKAGQKAAIIAAGPIANFLFAWTVYWAIFQLGVTTYPVQIEKILPNRPAAVAKIPANAVIEQINSRKIESWSDVNQALISAIGDKNLAFTYILHSAVTDLKNGSLVKTDIDISHWKFDLEKESPIVALGLIPKKMDIYPIVSKIVPNSAAEKAGLQIGDEIVSYNNHPYLNWNEVVEIIKKAGTISLTVKRRNSLIYLNLTPTLQENGEGVAGIYPTSNAVVKQYNFVEAFGRGLDQTALTIELTVRSLYQLVTGVIGLKQLSGPITIAKNAGQTASNGIVPYLYFLAFISISLGVINLVPLPMLDGGQLLLLLLEKVQGHPLSETAQAFVYYLGAVLIMIIMGIALFNDFLRL
ncbi:RIP metalloprotease RseP [Orbaceae bacterium ESL0721]|nr:RIP metalloprotease RseP [Orbaceae bacterium ESL0721]